MDLSAVFLGVVGSLTSCFFSWFTIIRRDVRICLFYHFAFM